MIFSADTPALFALGRFGAHRFRPRRCRSSPRRFTGPSRLGATRRSKANTATSIRTTSCSSAAGRARFATCRHLVAIAVNGEGYWKILGICEGADEDSRLERRPQAPQGRRPPWGTADHLRRPPGTCRKRCRVQPRGGVATLHCALVPRRLQPPASGCARLPRCSRQSTPARTVRQQAVWMIEKLRGLRLTRAAK
jgi:hypothetical protein